MGPGVKALVGDGDLFSGAPPTLLCTTWKPVGAFAVPDGCVEAVPRPGGIEIGAGAVAQHVLPRAIHVDDEDRTLPVDGDGIVLVRRKQTSMSPVLDQEGLKSM